MNTREHKTVRTIQIYFKRIQDAYSKNIILRSLINLLIILFHSSVVMTIVMISRQPVAITPILVVWSLMVGCIVFIITRVYFSGMSSTTETVVLSSLLLGGLFLFTPVINPFPPSKKDSIIIPVSSESDNYNLKLSQQKLNLNYPLSFYNISKCELVYYDGFSRITQNLNCQKTNDSVVISLKPYNIYGKVHVILVNNETKRERRYIIPVIFKTL